MLEKQWIVAELDDEKREQAKTLAEKIGCSTIVAMLLVNRGMADTTHAKVFMDKTLKGLHDPFLMKDMLVVCERIAKAIKQKEKVTIYGDYDVDGVTSTSVLVLYLRELQCNVDFYIPDRMEEGYGINEQAIKTIALGGSSLIVTVDCGVTAFLEVELAKKLGVDVIITDHHQCSHDLPQAVGVINPKRHDCAYPFKELAGVGVVFKLICGLNSYLKRETDEAFIKQYIDIVSIGTIADVMPLKGENRVIVKYGLDEIGTSSKIGVKALLNRSGVLPGKKITAGIVGFTLAPRINAAGRVGCAKRGVHLFLTKDNKDAFAIAEDLCSENQLRQQTELNIMEEAMEMLAAQNFSTENEKMIVLWKEHWHHGVIGIVASRISERYSCPVLLISLEGETGKGSGRSIKGFNLYEALKHCKDGLIKFGGHELAAGLSLKKEGLEAFKKDIVSYAQEHLDRGCMTPKLYIDCVLDGAYITIDTVRELGRLEPFGVGNPMPIFKIENLTILDIMSISNDKHIRLTLQKGDKKINAFVFSTSISSFLLSRGDVIDVACNIDINSYRGMESVQLVVKDAHLSETQKREHTKYQELYSALLKGKLTTAELADVIPSRASFVAVYRYIKQNAVGTSFCGRLQVLNRDIAWYSNIKINYATMMICFDVLKEFDLITYHEREDAIKIDILENEGKVNLNNSQILKKLKGFA